MEAERGRATSLGGTQRLRGYRTNRFYDSYTNLRGVELRWYVLETQDAFNFIVGENFPYKILFYRYC